jgi:NAD(P)-dependent dehydrogenase (short-subunit alcohol dehydrogenase family)
MPTVLITGSNRGLGLEWVRQCAARGWCVWATCRDPDSAADLQALAAQYPAVGVHRLDVTVRTQIAALAQALGADSLDLLVNNAGVYFER